MRHFLELFLIEVLENTGHSFGRGEPAQVVVPGELVHVALQVLADYQAERKPLRAK